MTNSYVEDYQKAAKFLAENGMYDPNMERDNCGVGLVAAIDGKPNREVLRHAFQATRALDHRGAVDADGKTGDGAGIHVQIPQEFFKRHIRRTGHDPEESSLAVGQVFLPKTDFNAQERCRCIVETEVLKYGYRIYGWRQVPVNIEVIGEKANATRPEIEQIMIANTLGKSNEDFENDLYIIRRRIENQCLSENLTEFYFCSLSCRSVIYKGMFMAGEITEFYPDLNDELFVSNFAIYHQRYSTNTFPQWRLAQPFRMIAHNGEINTLTGNVNWTKAHETCMASPVFGSHIEDIKPLITNGSSDSAALDAIWEVLVRAGRPAPAVKALMVPESIGQNALMPKAHEDLFAYSNSVMEPWDGPAAICGTDGQWIVAGLDRNGLRPLRYTITGDGILLVGSETGMSEVDESKVVEKGHVRPGGMIGIDLREGKFYHDRELKDWTAARKPYGEWVKNIVKVDQIIKTDSPKPVYYPEDVLCRQQQLFGFTEEDMDLILRPMVETGYEAIGSMGDDTPQAVLSDKYRGLHHFFRQAFSQVTNPPIDSLRETRVMSLRTRLSNLGNVLDEGPDQCQVVQLESPFLNSTEFHALKKYLGDDAIEIDCLFNPKKETLRESIDRIRHEAEMSVRGGKKHIILTDERMSKDMAPIPMILAAGAVHSYLVRQQLRTFTSVNVRSAEALDVQYYAVLIGVGATTVNAYMTEEAIASRHAKGLYGDLSFEECVENYKIAINKGLLKTMSKMGIGVISSYRGGYAFESVGLSRSVVAEFFPGMTSRISGIGLKGLQDKIMEMHDKAYGEDGPLAQGGFYRYRATGERHAHDPILIHKLQDAVATESYSKYREYADGVNGRKPMMLRDLLDFQSDRDPISVDRVESITEIRRRLCAPAISIGALSREAHETLAIAMNRIGAKSNSGEGGEDSERFKPRKNGDNANSAVKQVASGRFGVTAEYLNNCQELEIKVAQGAKPGEGGQLPGFKVSLEIAKLRHSTPGVTLISPPPHHDIYSIEDLAQLIYDLKQINPDARVCVKLVARSGVGTIAAGVAKAGADTIHISGYDGGTGASPQSSIKYAGLPWEMGLSEVNQVLTLNKLRHRIKLRTDGGFRTGRDVVIAAMLGAEEFGIGTTSLIAMGCIMVRQCHSNTCPVGVCTQDPELRKKFTGSAAKVVNLFTFIAEEVTEILASLGYSKLEDVIGRCDLLTQVGRGRENLDDLDLNPLLAQADTGDTPRFCTLTERNPVPDTLDAQIIKDAKNAIHGGEKMQLFYTIKNTHRSVGTSTSSIITRKYGMKGLEPDHLTVRMRGSAGNSLGAFAVQGLKLEIFGDANDYVGKGLSGGTIVVRPMVSSPLKSNKNTIVGNTCLYGATAGKLFASGQGGERFAVRNSGATAVIEGIGSNGCEYMTGGTVVVLGEVGANFGAGFTGGMAFVYDADGTFEHRVNPDNVIWQRIEVDHYENILKDLIFEYVKETHSQHAEQLLQDWEMEKGKIWQIIPKEMVTKLDIPATKDVAAKKTA